MAVIEIQQLPFDQQVMILPLSQEANFVTKIASFNEKDSFYLP